MSFFKNAICVRNYLCFLLSFTILTSTITPVFANDVTDIPVDNDVYVYNDSIVINDIHYTQEEFAQLLETATDVDIEMVEKQTRSGAIIALYTGSLYVPGVGQVVLLATGVIVVAGVTIAAGSWVYNTVVSYLKTKQANEISEIKNQIPNDLLNGDKVNLSKFKNKYSKSPNDNGSGSGPFTCGLWTIEKDTANHGGRVWKLFKSGKRIASLAADGKILAK